MAGTEDEGTSSATDEAGQEAHDTTAQSTMGEDERPPRLHVIRERLDLAATEALRAWMRKDTDNAGRMDGLAGYVLVAWNKDGRPAVYPRLFSPRNPIPAYVLPGYLQTALSWWIEDGMPDDYEG